MGSPFSSLSYPVSSRLGLKQNTIPFNLKSFLFVSLSLQLSKLFSLASFSVAPIFRAPWSAPVLLQQRNCLFVPFPMELCYNPAYQTNRWEIYNQGIGPYANISQPASEVCLVLSQSFSFLEYWHLLFSKTKSQTFITAWKKDCYKRDVYLGRLLRRESSILL